MLYLTTKQQRIFEVCYQELSPREPWRLIELFSRNGEARRIVHDGLPQIFARMFKGGRQGTRPLDTAVHEAGHAIMFTAIGYPVGSAWISGSSGRVSTGESTAHDEDDDGAIEPVNAMVPMPLAVMEILANCSGYVGESFSRDRRVNSDYHEKFLTYAQCRFLDDQAGSQPMTHWNLYMNSAREIIRKNDRLFWAVAGDLLASGALSDACRHRLNTQVIKPPVSLFFERIDIRESGAWRYPAEAVAA